MRFTRSSFARQDEAEWKKQRFTLWFGPRHNHAKIEVSLFEHNSTGIGLDLGGESELVLYASIYHLFFIAFSVWRILPGKVTKNWSWWDWSWGRGFSLKFYDGVIWWEFFNDSSGWSSTTPLWMQSSIDVGQAIKGKVTYSKETLDSGEATVCFLEGDYDIKWARTLSTWSHPRWFTNRIVRYELEIDKGIPVPGKGENSWDMEDNAVHSMTVATPTLAGALGRLTASVYRSRINYGGSVEWTPNSR